MNKHRYFFAVPHLRSYLEYYDHYHSSFPPPCSYVRAKQLPSTLDDVYEPSTMDKLRSAYHYGTDIVCVCACECMFVFVCVCVNLIEKYYYLPLGVR